MRGKDLADVDSAGETGWAQGPAEPWQGPIPRPDLDSRPFWDGLRDHKLMILRCDSCAYWIHTPLAGCPRCGSQQLTPRQVRGTGRIYSFTIVHREFTPGVKPPYVAALIDLDEQDSLRLVTQLVNVKVDEVKIGLPVEVVYHDIGEATLALFAPRGESD